MRESVRRGDCIPILIRANPCPARRTRSGTVHLAELMLQLLQYRLSLSSVIVPVSGRSQRRGLLKS